MKRSVIVLIVLLIGVFALFRFCSFKPEPAAEEKQNPLAIGENSGAFNQSFQTLLTSYYDLNEAFVSGDTVRINAASGKLQRSADSLKVSEIQGDSTGMITETAKSFALTIASSAVAITGEKDIENKRRELNVITDALWSLTRTVRFDGQKVYYQYCPMAFKNQGAYWLSANRQIRNPYFGSKMLTCGETTDSVDYSKR